MHRVKHCPMLRSFAVLQKKWASLDLILAMLLKYMRNMRHLPAEPHIDISELNYDILKEKRSVQWPYSKKINGFGTSTIIH